LKGFMCLLRDVWFGAIIERCLIRNPLISLITSSYQ